MKKVLLVSLMLEILLDGFCISGNNYYQLLHKPAKNNVWIWANDRND